MYNLNDLISTIEKCAIELKNARDKSLASKMETFEEAKRRIIKESNEYEKRIAQISLENLNDELNKDFRNSFNALKLNYTEELMNRLTQEHYHKYYCSPEGEKEYEDRFQKGLGFLHAMKIVQEYLNSNNGFNNQIKQRSINISNVARRNNRILEFYYKHIHNKFNEVNFPKIIVSTFYKNETITESACEKINSGYKESDGNCFDEIRLSVVIEKKQDISELQELLLIFNHSIREKKNNE